MDAKDKEIERLKKRIAGMEKTLEIVTSYSGRVEYNLKQLFEVISNTIPVPVIISSPDGDILFFNEKATQTFDYSDEVFYGKKIPDLYEQPKEQLRFLKNLDTQGEVKNFAVNLKKSDGSVFPVFLFSQRIIFEGKDCLLTILYDLSELKREEEKRLILERQLRQTQKMEAIGRFAGGISHDFNSILTIIFGNLQLSMMMLPTESAITENLKNALTAAKKAKEMISQILNFCRQKEQELKPVIIGDCIVEAYTMIQSLMSKKVKLTLTTAGKTPLILGDPVQIQQVLMNLCTNANYVLKDHGGVIEILLEPVTESGMDQGEHPMIIPKLKPGKYVRLTVKDNGPGIPKEIQERIFDPFFTTKAQGEGSGLGLSVVHGIVINHGGAVSVESELGKGAAFHCYFPVFTENENALVPVPDVKADATYTERILFVDYEQYILDVYGVMLETMGYQVVFCSDSKEALELFKEEPDNFDLVITEAAMPGLSGKAMAKKMLKIRPDIPLILTSGHEDNLEETPKIKPLRKPFTHKDIESLIRTILDKPQEN